MNRLSAITRWLWLAAPVALVLLLATTTSAQEAEVVNRWGPTPSASTYGHRFDWLFQLITILIGVSFLIVLVLLFVPALRDRARPGHKASFDHGSSLHDKRFTAIVSVVVFLVLDAWVLWVAMQDLREAYWAVPPASQPGVYRVEVLGQQWAWNFRAPGVDATLGTADDILTVNELTVPEGRPVVFNLTSKDVIHSLFLPDMRMKRDANPGAVNVAWFEATENEDEPVRTYDILCAELCGYAHYQMHGKLHVLSEELFDEWEQEASQMALAAFDENDTEAQWAWVWRE